MLAPGVYHFTTITIPSGVTVTTNGTGTLDLRATGAVTIAGAIDVSGSRGGNGAAYGGCAQGSTGGGGARRLRSAVGWNFRESGGEFDARSAGEGACAARPHSLYPRPHPSGGFADLSQGPFRWPVRAMFPPRLNRRRLIMALPVYHRVRRG